MAVSFKVRKYDRITRYPLAASQTIAVGDPLELNSSGLVIVATATSAALLGVAASACAASAALDPIMVYDDPKAEFIATCDAYAEAVQAIVGDEVDLIGSTGAFLVNLGASAVDVFVVKEVVSWQDPLLDGADFPFQNRAQVVVEINLHALSS